MIHCAQKYPPGGSPDPAEVQYLHGDLPAHHPDEHHQPGHHLHRGRGQVHSDPGAEHHLPDGAGLHLPLSVQQPPQHTQHQAGGGLAAVQPRLPFLCDHRHGPATGEDIRRVSCQHLHTTTSIQYNDITAITTAFRPYLDKKHTNLVQKYWSQINLVGIGLIATSHHRDIPCNENYLGV